MFLNNKITIVSRKSKLALQQAEIVKQQLMLAHQDIQVEIVGISTAGDEVLNTPLNKIGGKGLFVNELEKYLLENKADIAVHSMKDVPTTLADGLAIGAILTRADARDVFVSQKYADIYALPKNSMIGTSSLRRQAQILAIRPDLIVEPLRGNVETRIQKLLDEKYAAIILAAAGLQRLGLHKWLNCPLDLKQMLPAAGQGAIGIEYKITNNILPIIAALHDPITAACVNAERALNQVLDGGCQAPIAAYAAVENNQIILRGLVAEPHAKKIFSAQHLGPLTDAVAIGQTVAKNLLDQGAGAIITALKGVAWK